MNEINTNLILTSILDVEKRISKENNEYVRVSLSGFIENEKNVLKLKTSMSKNQWKNLKNAMNVTFLEKEQLIITGNEIKIEFNKDDVTEGNNPKPVFEKKQGLYNGARYDYYDLHVAVFIKNGWIEREIYKKDYSDLF